MRRKQTGLLAALVAAGVIALTACGGGAASTPSGDNAPAGAEQAQEQEQSPETDESGVDLLRGTNKSTKADQSSGDLAPAGAAPEVKAKWVELRAGSAGNLSPAVVNGAGRTLYWFSDDPAGGKVSNCNGECEKTWPPVVVDKGSKVIFSGIKRENLSIIKRNDGRSQVAIGGRPVYTFSKDTQAGDIKGQNVGGKWFVINPEGKRAVPAAEAPAPNPNPAPAPGAKTAKFLTFFSVKGFDPAGQGFSTGVRVDNTCKDLRRGFQSMTTDGTVKVWSEPGCKGKSATVSDDIPDAAAIGFPDGIKSYIGA